MEGKKYEETYFQRKDKISSMIELLRDAEDWRGILNVYDDAEVHFHEPLLVWVRPSMSMMEFFAKSLAKIGIGKILSIGCGCGFLEKLIQLATPLTVEGLEVNRGWWESPYSTPPFIPLNFTTAEEEVDLDSNAALMFCYFNGLTHFNQYLDRYEGTCVILIGPVNGEKHCEPEPYHLKHHPGWDLDAWHDIRSAHEDHIAIYVRKR